VKGARAKVVNKQGQGQLSVGCWLLAVGCWQGLVERQYLTGLTCFTFRPLHTYIHTDHSDALATQQNPQALFNLTKSKETARRINNETDEGPLWARKTGSAAR